MRRDFAASLIGALFLMGACNAPFPSGITPPVAHPDGTATVTPFLPAPPSATPVVVHLWLSPASPRALQVKLERAAGVAGDTIEFTPNPSDAELHIVAGGQTAFAEWTYAVAAPFPTTRDSITLAELGAAWRAGDTAGLPVFASAETVDVMRAVLGEPGPNVRSIDHPDTMIDAAWETRPSLAIVPFDALEPRWKVLELDGQSPVRRGFNPAEYPLRIAYGLEGGDLPEGLREALELAEGRPLPMGNRRDDRLTTVVMTGVTALTRATAWEMERTGVTRPAADIGDWLRQADVTHISNEVAFAENCPRPSPNLNVLIFCSQPDHIALLEDVGADVIELTGNHVRDFGPEALRYTLDLYRARGWEWFGGGADLQDSQDPVLIEHNGNRIAFVGCNEAGPPEVWSTEDSPGAAPCGADRLTGLVGRLREDGYLPIFTFQWHEHYAPTPTSSQREVFRAAAEAGAVAVSGSQAHQPQGFAFHNGAFIHFGLGNLFFDQMWSEAVRQEFVDRYVFYDGRLLSVEVLTAYLEDWSRPRPMTPTEREAFLENIFTASGW